MNAWKIILAALLIFSAGLVTGLLVEHHWDAPSAQRSLPLLLTSPRAGQTNAAIVRTDFLKRAQKDLDLTPEQHKRIDEILKESQDRTKRIWEPIKPFLDEELENVKEEFLDVLTPAQRAHFDEMLQQQRLKDEKKAQAAREKAVSTPLSNPVLTNLPALTNH